MIKIINIDKEFMLEYVNDFISILEHKPNEYWHRDHFLYEYPEKWELSLAIMEEDTLVAYIIASRKISAVHIHKFMVHSNHRNKGVGTLLLNLFEQKLKTKTEIVTLKVYSDNLSAIRFYERHGYCQIKKEGNLITYSKRL